MIIFDILLLCLLQFIDVKFILLQDKEKERKKRMEAEKSKRKPVVDINAGLFLTCFYTIIQLVSGSRSPTSCSIQIRKTWLHFLGAVFVSRVFSCLSLVRCFCFEF